METIEHIAALWQRATAALQAIDVTFIISEVVAQEQLPPIVTQSIGETNHIRPAASHRGMLRVAMDREKVRLEKQLPIYSVPRGEFIDQKETTVFDGTRTLQLLEYPNNEHHQKQGGVCDGREICSLGLLQYVPINWLLGLHGKRDLSPSEHSIQRAPRNSVVIRHNRLNTNMLVDRDRGYLVTRFSGERPGRNASWEVDVSYEPLSPMLWSPTRRRPLHRILVEFHAAGGCLPTAPTAGSTVPIVSAPLRFRLAEAH